MLDLRVVGDALELEGLLGSTCDLLVGALDKLLANHEVGELLLGGVGHLDRLDRLAAAKNRDVVRDAHNLAHLV